MSDLDALVAQREAIDKQIAELRISARMDAIAQVRALVHDFDLTKEDIFVSERSRGRKVAGPRQKVSAKYRDQATGDEWTGRGMTPKWLSGKDKSKYLIAKD